MAFEGTLRILIVDDHPIVAEGIQQLIAREEQWQVCGSAPDANTALALIEKHQPQVMIVDISLKGSVNGIDLIKAIKNRYPEIRMIVLSMHDESLYAERAIRAGARGYIMKNEMTATIVNAIHMVMDNEIYLSKRITSKILDNLLFDNPRGISNPVEKLTNRELEVIQLIADGIKSSEIARKLSVGVKTVETHRLRIKNKLNLKSNAELIKFAVEWVRDNRSSSE